MQAHPALADAGFDGIFGILQAKPRSLAQQLDRLDLLAASQFGVDLKPL
jgi:hypothetical protein